MKSHQRLVVFSIALLAFTFSAACRKRAPIAAAPAPPATVVPAPLKPNAPTISEFAVEPNSIERGQSATLRWQVEDATQIHINQGIGAVSDAGRRTISPQSPTTYTLTATGPGGTTTAAATLDVTAPPPPVPRPAAPAVPTISERLENEVHDAYFDFDKFYLREDATATLEKDAQSLKLILSDFPTTTVALEGHCDERGSAEYNLGLGDRRAAAAKEFLEQLGVPVGRLLTISYGKERPQCTESDETCWQLNRRVHFTPGETQKLSSENEKSFEGNRMRTH